MSQKKLRKLQRQVHRKIWKMQDEKHWCDYGIRQTLRKMGLPESKRFPMLWWEGMDEIRTRRQFISRVYNVIRYEGNQHRVRRPGRWLSDINFPQEKEGQQ